MKKTLKTALLVLLTAIVLFSSASCTGDFLNGLSDSGLFGASSSLIGRWECVDSLYDPGELVFEFHDTYCIYVDEGSTEKCDYKVNNGTIEFTFYYDYDDKDVYDTETLSYKFIDGDLYLTHDDLSYQFRKVKAGQEHAEPTKESLYSDMLQGTWVVTEHVILGQNNPTDDMYIVFDDDDCYDNLKGNGYRSTFFVDAKNMEITVMSGNTYHSYLFELSDDKLTLWENDDSSSGYDFIVKMTAPKYVCVRR